MPLKAKLVAEEFEKLDEGLRAFYKTAADGAYVLDAEGVEDVTGLKRALDEVRADRTKLREEIKNVRSKYGDVDPDEAKRAISEMQQLHDKKLLDEGKVEELIQKRVERMRLEHENQLKARDKRSLEIEEENKKLSSRLSEVLIDTSLTSAATAAKVRPTAIPDVINRGRQVWRLDGNDPKPMQSDGTVIIGKDGKSPLTMDEWLSSLQQTAPHLFEPSSGSGSDPNAGGLKTVGRQIVLTRDQARDVQTFRQAQAEAAKQGVELIVQG